METKKVRLRAPGVISATECYTLREFQRRVDVGDHSWRDIRQKIRVRKVGKKLFILGQDWLDYLAEQKPAGTPKQDEPPTV